MATIRGAAYSLAHVPELVAVGGTTPAAEQRQHPDSEYLRRLPGHLRGFAECVAYPPHQVYIGDLSPHELAEIPRPWHEHLLKEASPRGPWGDIVAQDVFYLALKQADVFDLVGLEAGFVEATRARVPADLLPPLPIPGPAATDLSVLRAQPGVIGLPHQGQTVGYVRRAHDFDPSLSAGVVLENLAAKATAVLALQSLLTRLGLDAGAIDYLIETSEEAVGDMNQRGGGNLAKAVGETCGCVAATGVDLRAFCAAPAHGLVVAAALVDGGVFEQVVVLGGGALAKLGLNSRDHVLGGRPVLEDVLGAFAVLVAGDDGIHPVLRTDRVGRLRIGSGTSPQAVIEALVIEPLRKAGLTVRDVDRYAAELQNPDITEPAGAGDVPRSNYRLIAATGVRHGQLARAEFEDFVSHRGLPGFAPTQGHIPSGVPYIGHACRDIMDGRAQRVMIIGKGSLFLGRMTGLFDGISVLIEKNPGPGRVQGDVVAEVRKVVGEVMRAMADQLAEP